MVKAKAASIILLAILLCAALPTILLVNGQTNQRTEETMVAIAERASNEIQTLITATYADEKAVAGIENVSLTTQFQSNVTFFQTAGLGKLTAAKEALANNNYDLASESALAALSLYRQIYSSLEFILSTAGLTDYSNLTAQGLSDAITREIQRIETLQSLLPTGTSQDILTVVSEVNRTLLQAKVALQSNQTETAEQRYVEAKQNITKIYQYLETQAEESNTWRIKQYCEMLQLRIQESFNYGNNNGINFTSTLTSLGYQSENAFMQTLESKIQSAQHKGNIHDAITECISISQLVQQTYQELNQAINHQQQGQTSSGSNGSGGSNTTGPTTGGNSTSSGGSNIGGNGGSSSFGNGTGGNH